MSSRTAARLTLILVGLLVLSPDLWAQRGSRGRGGGSSRGSSASRSTGGARSSSRASSSRSFGGRSSSSSRSSSSRSFGSRSSSSRSSSSRSFGGRSSSSSPSSRSYDRGSIGRSSRSGSTLRGRSSSGRRSSVYDPRASRSYDVDRSSGTTRSGSRSYEPRVYDRGGLRSSDSGTRSTYPGNAGAYTRPSTESTRPTISPRIRFPRPANEVPGTSIDRERSGARGDVGRRLGTDGRSTTTDRSPRVRTAGPSARRRSALAPDVPRRSPASDHEAILNRYSRTSTAADVAPDRARRRTEDTGPAGRRRGERGSARTASPSRSAVTPSRSDGRDRRATPRAQRAARLAAAGRAADATPSSSPRAERLARARNLAQTRRADTARRAERRAAAAEPSSQRQRIQRQTRLQSTLANAAARDRGRYRNIGQAGAAAAALGYVSLGVGIGGCVGYGYGFYSWCYGYPWYGYGCSYWNYCGWFGNWYWRPFSTCFGWPYWSWWWNSRYWCPRPFTYSTVIYGGYDDDDGSYADGYADGVAAAQPVEEAYVEEPRTDSRAIARDRYLQLGDSAFREGRYADAVHFYARAIDFAPTDGVLYLVLSDALFATGDYHYGAYALRRALELDGALAKPTVDKRTFYGDTGDFDRQLQVLERFLVDRPNDDDARLLLASNYLFGGMPGAAVALLEAPESASLAETTAGALILSSAREAAPR